MMNHKVLFGFLVCFLLMGFLSAQEKSFVEKVEYGPTFAENQEVLDSYVYPQLAGGDKHRLTILACYFSYTKGSITKVRNAIKLSDVDSLAFRWQVLSLYNTKAIFHLYIITPGSGILTFTTQEYDLKSNNLAYLSISWQRANWPVDPAAGTYMAIILCDEKDGSASGASRKTALKLY